MFDPRDWLEGFRAVWSARRRGPVPIPSAPYLAWRRHTAYGTPGWSMRLGEVLGYLEWRRRVRRLH